MRDEDAKRPQPGRTDAGTSADDGADDPPTDGAGTRAAPDAAQEVAVLKAELTELKDRWMRERADLENFKRRATKEKSDALRFGSEALLKDLIPIIDNLHRALAHARTSNEVDPIVTGVEMVLRGFDEVLGRHGVKVVEARGVPFDPTRHEAISHIESEEPPNTVIDEHQRGYVLHDRLLRPALVTVGKGRRPDVAKPSDDD